MARLAEAAGFKAVYLSGGSLGWYKCVTEANITITELAQVAVDMRAASKLPVVLDAGGGFGDPVHMHRTDGSCRLRGHRDRGPVAAAPLRAPCRHRSSGAAGIHAQAARRGVGRAQ